MSKDSRGDQKGTYSGWSYYTHLLCLDNTRMHIWVGHG